MKTILSNTTKGSIVAILQEVKKRLQNKEDCIILTADRSVANMEKQVLDTLVGCGAEFGVNVMSFNRFCAKTMGNDVKRCLTPEGSVMLLADVIEKCHDQFVYYHRVRPDSLAGEVYAALTALRNSGISTADLREKAEKMPVSLKNKAQDLALMYEGYLEALADKRHDSSTRLEALASLLEEDAGKYKTMNFFVVGMEDFNHPQLNVIKALDKGAKSLTIGLVSGFDNRNSRIYLDNTVKKILAISGKRSADTVELDNLGRWQNSIVKNLFSYEKLPAKEIVDVGESVKIKEAPTRQDEVLWVALDIVKKIMNEGKRFKDFEILIGSEDYIPIIRNVFDRYGIQYFIDQKELLQKQTKAKYILSALAVLTKNYRNDEVLDFVKNPLFELSLEEDENISRQDKIFRFENYVLEYSINYNKFLQPFDCDEGEKLQVAEEVRQALVKTLSVLGGNEMQPMSDIVAKVRQFVNDIQEPWKEHVEVLAGLSKESKHYKKCAEQVDNKINGILTEIEGVLTGDSNLEKFDSILRSMLKTLKIALVPTSVDTVIVGDTSTKFTGQGDLYVLGANSGCLPSENAGGVVITAKDEELFSEAGIGVYPTQRDRIRQNLFTLIEILSMTKGNLAITYSLSSVGGELRPSSIVPQFGEMFVKKVKVKKGEEYVEEKRPLTPERISFDKLREGMMSPKDISVMFATKDSVMHNILTYAESGSASESDMDIYRTAYKFLDSADKDALDKMGSAPATIEKGKNTQKTSISRLEQYFKCPFGYFLKYTLGLQKRKEGEMENFDAGTILHAIFEKFFTELKEGRATRENVEHIVLSAFDEMINDKNNKRILRLYTDKPDARRMIDRMKNEGIRTCKDFYEISLHSKFKTQYLEAEFISEDEAQRKYGKGAKDIVRFDTITLDVDGRTVEIRGKIDRVDSNGENFIILDYKTFKGAGLSATDIYHGEKLQLYIYAKAMKDNTMQNIAGVFYVPVYVGFNKNDDKRYSYEGQVTDNEKIRNEIFGDTEEGVVSYFKQDTVLPVPKNATSTANTYLSDKDFDARCRYAVDLATECVREIDSGYIYPCPIGDCTNSNCDFKGICPYRDMNSRERYNVQATVFNEYDKVDEKREQPTEDNGGEN